MGLFTTVVMPVLAGVAAWLGVVGMRMPYQGMYPVLVDEARLARMPSYPPDFENGAVKYDERLSGATRLFEGDVEGAEDVAVGEDGTLFLGDQYGWIHVGVVASGEKPGYTLIKNVTYVGPGRPLGMKVLQDRLLVCNSLTGLLEVRRDPKTYLEPTYTPLVTLDHNKHPIVYANSVDVYKPGHQDEVIYFTASSTKPVLLNTRGFYDAQDGSILNLMHGEATGRLYSYTKHTKTVKLVHDSIWFANGVVASEDGKYVYFVETFGYRVVKVEVATGIASDVVTGLPGAPDGLAQAADGSLWVSLVIPLSPISSVLPYRIVRFLLSWLPVSILGGTVPPYAGAIRFSATGVILDALLDPTGRRINGPTNVRPHNSRLFFGHLTTNYISYYDLQ